MRHLKQWLARCSVGLSLAAVLAGSAVAPTLADTITGTSTVSGSPVAISGLSASTASFLIALNGTDQDSAAVPIGIDVADDSGTGNGWQLQVAATTFADGGAHTLADTGTLSLSGVTEANNGSGTYTTPTNSITAPVAITTAATTPTAVSFYNAAVSTGMGNFTVTPSFVVQVPANAYASTYTSTITVSVVSGP
jgi:WxL domain surface cell wall-binding